MAVDLTKLMQELTEQGKLIEAGWIGLRIAAIPADASELQLAEMRQAFFAGAQHLFSSIMHILDPGEDPTTADLRRMDLIDNELREFIADFSAKYITTKGNA